MLSACQTMLEEPHTEHKFLISQRAPNSFAESPVLSEKSTVWKCSERGALRLHTAPRSVFLSFFVSYFLSFTLSLNLFLSFSNPRVREAITFTFWCIFDIVTRRGEKDVRSFSSSLVGRCCKRRRQMTSRTEGGRGGGGDSSPVF